MKRIFPILLAIAVICTTLLPVAYATDTGISIDISAESASRIELDQFYNVGGANNWNNSTNQDERASGGAYTMFCNGSGSGVNTNYAEVSFNVCTTASGEYSVKFVAGPNVHAGWSSRVELLVNGTELIDTVDTTYISDPTPDEAFPSGTNPAGVPYNFDMKLYEATVNLTEGSNTITIKVAGETNYNKLCFAVDYLEFAPPERLMLSDVEATRIELDQFYGEAKANGWSNSTHTDERASEGSYTLFCNGMGTFSEIYEKSFDVYAPFAGEYTVEFMAGPASYGGWNSLVELFINGTETIDTVDTEWVSDPTPDASFPSGVGGGDVAYDFDMHLYRATVNLAEGKNTVAIRVTSTNCNYKKLCFALDYIEFKPAFDYVANLTLEGLTAQNPDEVTATAKIVNKKSDLSDVNAVMIVAMFDENGGIVKWGQSPVQCANGNNVTVSLNLDTTVTDEEISAVVSARAYLRDCGEETSPTIFNAKMTLLAPECEVVLPGE